MPHTAHQDKGLDIMGDTLRFEEKSIRNVAVIAALRQIDTHQQEVTRRLESMEQKIDGITKAFPQGNFESHRHYHETMQEMIAERRRLRVAIQEKTISGLIWAGLVAIGIAVFHELQTVLVRK
jgi:hypothetical protein